MTVVLLGRDLLFGSRIADVASRAGATFLRVEDPGDLPPAGEVDLLLVDWGDRAPDWGDQLAAWCPQAPESARPRMILFGPHADLAAHAEARSAGLGPMLARSKLLAVLASLLQ